MKLWIDATNLDGQSNLQVAVGREVSNVTDLSGGGNHFSTSSNGKMPVLTDMNVGRPLDVSKMVEKIQVNGGS